MQGGRFLLIADEAQFCGADTGDGGGTRAGTLIQKLSQFAAHTLLLSGTPYRSDGNPLILAEYGELGSDGKKRLLYNVKADYRDGVREGYLRRFQATLQDARVRFKDDTDSVPLEYDLSSNGDYLREVIRKPEVWQPIADRVVADVREKQKANPEYRGLISCMEMADANRVYAYLTKRYPELSVKKATTEDGPQAKNVLTAFKGNKSEGRGGDILVTVRMAFIGYDCKMITVVGVLTNYRDWGHLEQLVGRGLRIDGEIPGREQSCRVVAPDDPKMTKFIEFMRGESEQGLRERREREVASGESADGPSGFVESAQSTTVRAVSNDVSLNSAQLALIETVKHDVGATDDPTVLAQLVEKLGFRLPASAEPVLPPTVPPISEVPETEQQQVENANRETSDVIKRYLSRQNISVDAPDYSDHIKRVTYEVNKRAGWKAADCRTVEQAKHRLRVAQDLLGERE